MLKTLRKKLTTLAALLTGSVVLAVCLVSFLLLSREYVNSRDLGFRLTANALGTQWQTENFVSVDYLNAYMQANGIQAALWQNGIPMGYGATDWVQTEALQEKIPENQEENAVYFSSGDFRCGFVKLPMSFGQCQFLIWQDTAPERAHLLQMGLIFGGIALLSLCAVAVLSSIISGRAIKPAQEAMERQESFVAAASHELRSPLTVLRTGFSVIDAEPEQTEHTLSLMRRETERMSRLVDELLLLAGGGQLRRQFHGASVELDTLLIDFADSMERVAEQAGLRLEVQLQDEAIPPVTGDKDLLCRLLTILTENALGYGPKGTQVRLTLETSGRWVLLSVADHGPGVPDSEKERIFDRFYRGSQSRTDTNHFGLGLSVAKELVALHGGSIRVLDTPGGGATFQVRLPC